VYLSYVSFGQLDFCLLLAWPILLCPGLTLGPGHHQAQVLQFVFPHVVVVVVAFRHRQLCGMFDSNECLTRTKAFVWPKCCRCSCCCCFPSSCCCCCCSSGSLSCHCACYLVFAVASLWHQCTLFFSHCVQTPAPICICICDLYLYLHLCLSIVYLYPSLSLSLCVWVRIS